MGEFKDRVVFVDDDRFYATQWIEKLREQFDVDHFIDAGEARDAILESSRVRCLIIDVMMPTPSTASAEETASGLETGLWLLRQIAEWVTVNSIPVIVLTNRESEKISNAVKSLNLPAELVEIRRKLDTDRKRLLELVRDKITKWSGDAS